MSDQDAELVRRTMAGERAAFEALVAAHLARTRAIARAVVGDQAAVDDVVQEGFLRAYDRLGQLTEPATFPSWLGTIVRNEAITWLRRNVRNRALSLDQVDPGTDDHERPDNPQLERLRQALPRLSPAYREILALKYDAGCDYDRIADTLGISVQNVEKRLYRARQALLKLME